MSTVHAPAAVLARRVARCPVCHARGKSRQVWRLYTWYGPDVTCCRCGATWGDERPVRRGRRGEAIARAARAREDWARALTWDAAIAEATRRFATEADL